MSEEPTFHLLPVLIFHGIFFLSILNLSLSCFLYCRSYTVTGPLPVLGDYSMSVQWPSLQLGLQVPGKLDLVICSTKKTVHKCLDIMIIDLSSRQSDACQAL